MKLAFALLLAGCYDATLADGLPCSESRGCPEGQSCSPGENVCLTEEPPHHAFAQISAGAHTCAVDTDHDLYCWGPNTDGELGLGDTDPRAVPTRVGTDSDWEMVAAGLRFTVGLKTDGSVWVWGVSTVVGDTGSMVPIPFTAVTDAETIVAGVNVFGAIDRDRNAVIAGEALIPTMFDGPWDAITVSGHHYCGLQGGDLYCWGQNANGQVGSGASDDEVTTPTQIRPDKTWRAVQAGYVHTCAADDDGALWCWGDNDDGQLGLADLDAEPHEPELVEGAADVEAISGAFDTTCARQASGTSWCFGEGRSGEVGDATADAASTGPRVVVSVVFEQLSAGFGHTCGISFQSVAYCWGEDSAGQLGDGEIGRHLEPTLVADFVEWRAVAVGERHSCGIASDGIGRCWGKNGHGQLGDGSTVRRGAPAHVAGQHQWDVASVGFDHTCMIDTAQKLWCWGAADRGQLGLGEGPDVNTPAQVGDGSWVEVAAGDGGTCAIDTDGELWCWGRAFGFQPTRVGTGDRWTEVHHGSDGAMCALDAGTPACWSLGASDDPEIRDASVEWERLAVAKLHACGIAADGTMGCSGDNSQGALGDGGMETDPEAIATPTISDGWTAVAAGEAFTCGIHDGDLYCWGWNDFGQVGDETTARRLEPVMLADDDTWVSVAAAYRSVCAIEADGDLRCWGVTHGPDGGWDEPAFVAAP